MSDVLARWFSHLSVAALVGVWIWTQTAIPAQIDGSRAARAPEPEAPIAAPSDADEAFVRETLRLTEQVWTRRFEAGAMGPVRRYDAPELRLIARQVQTPCGPADRKTGPLYCAALRRIYIDPAFGGALALDLPPETAEFARALLIAKTVAAHVQELTGLGPSLERLRPLLPPSAWSAVEDRLALQADCLVGVWARDVDRRLAPLRVAEIDRALSSAFAFSDRPTPERLARRAAWFEIGFSGGEPEACDAFAKPEDSL